MKGDTKVAVDFLRDFYPDGPWLLTSISVDKKSIETRLFTAATVDAMVAWVDGHNGQRNMYFSVNPPTASRETQERKAKRTDIARVCYLHVDVDPRAGEPLKEEQERALHLCTDKLPSGVPQPTCVVFSGGGYQAFWKLETPLEIEGSLERAEEYKLYNIQLERLFGADNCHNIDRIMRLPGTVNVPDAKKAAKGRVAALAAIVKHHPGLAYPIAKFAKAQAVQMQTPGLGGGAGANAVKVQVSSNIPRLDSVDDLNEWNVPDRVKVIIVQGTHPDEPKEGDNSRSAWLFDVCCNLVRCGVPDDVVYSVITDPDFGIADSVLDKGSNAERYALRNIANAKEEAIDPNLRTLNQRHAVIENWGGKCRVIEEIDDPAFQGRSRLTKQSFEDFRNRFMHKRVKVGVDSKGQDQFMPMGHWWLGNPQRRQFRTIVFSPGREAPEDYNLWRGFKYESRPGDCSLFLAHVRDNICAGDEGHYTYLLSWMARAVQKPDSPGQVAVVLRGGMGTGKGFFAKTFGGLFGRHFLQVSDPKHLVGSFNNHLRDCVVLFGDEAFYAGDKKHESVLKTLITEETTTIEAKGVDVEVAPNYTHIVLASNSQWVVPAGGDDRRFFVLDVGGDKKQNVEYFRAIATQLEAGGYEALLHELQTRDLSGFEVRAVPKTAALQEQKIFSLTPEEEWWFRKLEDGRLLSEHNHWQVEVVRSDVFTDYIEYARAYNIPRRGNETLVGRFLKKVCPGLYPRTKMLNATLKGIGEGGYQIERTLRLPHYIFPPLADLRAHWEGMYGKTDWPQAPEQQQDLGAPEIPF